MAKTVTPKVKTPKVKEAKVKKATVKEPKVKVKAEVKAKRAPKEYIEINDPEETIIIPVEVEEEEPAHVEHIDFVAEELAKPDFTKDPNAFVVEPDGEMFKVTAKNCVVWLTQKQMDNNEIYRAINSPVKYKKK
tara:strand:- start:12368 stop:12769 length:402 start_codon:yes stop_codon:yes gene_type:complete